ncbi:MAG: hypothetical protein DMG13_20940 [Acidobacteria bacterium]|nr:MAG: hypothetical protein DMG13_20940 [Acidobacteriota bacterium]
MNSDLAEALRLIFPLTARGATVDFFGTDALDFFTEDFEDEAFVELLFGFDDVLFDDDDRIVDERDEETRPFWASDPTGMSKKTARRIRQVRVRMRGLLPSNWRPDYQQPSGIAQVQRAP